MKSGGGGGCGFLIPFILPSSCLVRRASLFFCLSLVCSAALVSSSCEPEAQRKEQATRVRQAHFSDAVNFYSNSVIFSWSDLPNENFYKSMGFITHVHVGKTPKDKFWKGIERWLDECSYFHTQYWSIKLLYYQWSPLVTARCFFLEMRRHLMCIPAPGWAPMRRSNNLQATFMCMFIRRARDRYNDKLIDAVWTETCLEITLYHGNIGALKKSRPAYTTASSA